jgi:hypothetical protein
MFNPSIVSTPASNVSGQAPTRMMNDVDLCVWVADAKPGGHLVYYTGHLNPFFPSMLYLRLSDR